MAETKSKGAKAGRYSKSRKGVGGRKPVYRDTFPDLAQRVCLLGATDTQVAIFFSVDISTIDRWKIEHPEFARALKTGKQEQDMEVAGALLQRALGAEVVDNVAVKVKRIEYDENTGKKVKEWEEVVTKEVIRRYPPDTAAARYWMTVRHKDYWVEPGKIEQDTSDTGDLKRIASAGKDDDAPVDDRLVTLGDRYRLAIADQAKRDKEGDDDAA